MEVVRYTGSDQYELSLAVAQALVDADGGTSEWVVLASGESWADAATDRPIGRVTRRASGPSASGRACKPPLRGPTWWSS